jgi:hypothetical protein
MAYKRVRELELVLTHEETEGALKRIVVNSDPELDTVFGIQYRNDIVHAGGLKVILRVMKDHHDSSIIQDLCCQALSNLAFESDKIRVVTAQLGGISAITTAMKAHRNDEHLQWHALQALWRLSLNDWVRERIVKKGSAHIIRETMADHQTSKEYVHFWGDLLLRHLREPPMEIYFGGSRDVPEWLIDLGVAILLVLFFRSLY